MLGDSRSYGPAHRWFAWHPVDTEDRGWVWLRHVWRRRYYLNLTGHPAMRWWVYACEIGDCDRDDEWDECSPHLWLDRPESDTHVCDICGVERNGPPPSTRDPADA